MKKIVLFCAVALLATSCWRTTPKIVSAELKPIAATEISDSAMLSLIEPYKQAQAVEMGVVIGESEQLMHASLPEGLLNAFVSDAMLQYANTQKPTDIAITNFGGLRNDLPQGPITVGHIFQIMPFDNALVFLELRGEDVEDLADAIAAKGGEVQSGLSLTIDDDGEADNVRVNGKPIDDERIYRIVTTDYLSYGNDHLEPLANYVKIETLGVMLRDALIEHISRETQAGKTIRATLKNQIHVEK